jgi:hypothetical protein
LWPQRRSTAFSAGYRTYEAVVALEQQCKHMGGAG